MELRGGKGRKGGRIGREEVEKSFKLEEDFELDLGNYDFIR